MNNNADLTICIPAYNNNTSLERALNSIKDPETTKEIVEENSDKIKAFK